MGPRFGLKRKRCILFQDNDMVRLRGWLLPEEKISSQEKVSKEMTMWYEKKILNGPKEKEKGQMRHDPSATSDFQLYFFSTTSQTLSAKPVGTIIWDWTAQICPTVRTKSTCWA